MRHSRANQNKNCRQCLLLAFFHCLQLTCSFNSPPHFSGGTIQKFKQERTAVGKSNTVIVWRTLLHETNNGSRGEQVRENEEEPILSSKTQQLPRAAFPPPDIGQAMQMMGTSPRRVFLSIASSTAIALIANLFGITSNLLSQLPEDFSESFGLDYVYPRNGFKRVMARNSRGGGAKCSFLIPKDWVADTGLALAQAQRQAKALDFSMNTNSRGGVLPDAAFGPPGRLDSQGLSNGDTNVSVIINSGVKKFSLKESLGEPSVAADMLISSRFRRPTKLLSAVEVWRGQMPLYQFEYIVDRGEMVPPLRATSVIAGGPDGYSYITLTVVAPASEWDKPAVDEKLRKIVNSLKVA